MYVIYIIIHSVYPYNVLRTLGPWVMVYNNLIRIQQAYNTAKQCACGSAIFINTMKTNTTQYAWTTLWYVHIKIIFDTRSCARTHTHRHTHKRTHARTHIHTHAHRHTHTHTHSRMRRACSNHNIQRASQQSRSLHVHIGHRQRRPLSTAVVKRWWRCKTCENWREKWRESVRFRAWGVGVFAASCLAGSGMAHGDRIFAYSQVCVKGCRMCLVCGARMFVFGACVCDWREPGWLTEAGCALSLTFATYTCMYMYVYIYIYIICMGCGYTCMFFYIHTPHTHAHTNTHTHTQTHTQTHTYRHAPTRVRARAHMYFWGASIDKICQRRTCASVPGI
jgi:hypothetical protein